MSIKKFLGAGCLVLAFAWAINIAFYACLIYGAWFLIKTFFM